MFPEKIMKHDFKSVLHTAFLGLVISNTAHAATLITNQAPIAYTNGSWIDGVTFTANRNLTVTKLGYFDFGDTNAASHEVGIYDSIGTLLVSVDITPKSSYSNNFDWKAITNFQLIADRIYTLEGVSSTDNYDVSNSSNLNSAVTLLSLTNAPGTVLMDTATNTPYATTTGNSLFNGPNFQFDTSSVPEPTSITLIAAGLLGFMFAYKK